MLHHHAEVCNTCITWRYTQTHIVQRKTLLQASVESSSFWYCDFSPNPYGLVNRANSYRFGQQLSEWAHSIRFFYFIGQASFISLCKCMFAFIGTKYNPNWENYSQTPAIPVIGSSLVEVCLAVIGQISSGVAFPPAVMPTISVQYVRLGKTWWEIYGTILLRNRSISIYGLYCFCQEVIATLVLVHSIRPRARLEPGTWVM